MPFEHTTPSYPFLCLLNFDNNFFLSFVTRIVLAIPKRLLCVHDAFSLMRDVWWITFDPNRYPICFELDLNDWRNFDILRDWRWLNKDWDAIQRLFPFINYSILMRIYFPVFELIWTHYWKYIINSGNPC